jgi:L-alanine-DL-glutamate epimerase-like enolase superfamily enzyme
MKLKTYRIALPLKHAFTISRETISTQSSLIVELESDGVRGYGEVTENAFYGHTYASIAKSLDKVSSSTLERLVNEKPQDLWTSIHGEVEGDMFALSALDMAAHDFRGKRLGIPTWKDWGLSWTNVPESSFTIGIDTVARMVEKLLEEPGWGIYKIKLGTKHDIEIVQELRRHTQAVFRVDANCGWSADDTIANSKALAKLGVEFIEQPLPIDAHREDKLRVYENAAVQIIADESCQVLEDVERCVGFFHGVNIKICKCGGLSPAFEMLVNAKQLGLKTMVGCMVESSVGISGAAQLLPLLDYADLDGAVLLRDEPCDGVSVVKGKIELAGRPGCGADLDFQRLPGYLVADRREDGQPDGTTL